MNSKPMLNHSHKSQEFIGLMTSGVIYLNEMCFILKMFEK